MECRKSTAIKKSFGFEAWFLVIVLLLAFSLTFVILNKVWGEIKTPLSEGIENSVDNATAINKVLNQTTSAGFLWDKMIPFIIIGLFAFVMILAGTIIKHPIMIFVGIIIMAIIILLAVVYSNVYHSITDSAEFASTTAQMPIQDKFMKYMPILVFVLGIGIVLAIIWSRKGGGSSSL